MLIAKIPIWLNLRRTKATNYASESHYVQNSTLEFRTIPIPPIVLIVPPPGLILIPPIIHFLPLKPTPSAYATTIMRLY